MKLNISKFFTYALAATFVGPPSMAFAAEGNFFKSDDLGWDDLLAHFNRHGRSYGFLLS